MVYLLEQVLIISGDLSTLSIGFSFSSSISFGGGLLMKLISSFCCSLLYLTQSSKVLNCLVKSAASILE